MQFEQIIIGLQRILTMDFSGKHHRRHPLRAYTLTNLLKILDATWTNNDCCYHGYNVGLVNDVLLWKPYQGHKSMRGGFCSMEELTASVVSDVSMGFLNDTLHWIPFEIIQWPTHWRCLMQYSRITIVDVTVSPYGILTMHFIWNVVINISLENPSRIILTSSERILDAIRKK